VSTGKAVHYRTEPLADDACWSIAFCPDKPWAVLGSKNGKARLWDTASWTEVRPLNGHTGAVTCAVVSPDGRRALTGSVDKTVHLRDLASGQSLYCFRDHTGEVLTVAFSPDGRLAVSAGADKAVRVWGLPEPEVRASPPSPTPTPKPVVVKSLEPRPGKA